jgi:hypothetical protein
MFGRFKRPAIYDSQFEQTLTYDIAIPTDEAIRKRIDGCNEDPAKRGLSGSSLREVLEKDPAGSLLLHLQRVQHLRGVLQAHGWRQKEL